MTVSDQHVGGWLDCLPYLRRYLAALFEAKECDFDYGNARLRAMKSRLLTRRELEALVESSSISGLITALTRTAYRKPVELALVRASDMDCIVEAVRIDLVSTLGTLGNFYQGSAREMVILVLRAYDIHNLASMVW
jgi:V/A-type H+-transporting ATPase subunit C